MKSLKDMAERPEWQDWHWQMRIRIRDVEGLTEWIPVSESLRAGIEACGEQFRMAVTPYFLSLADPSDPEDPILKQCIPSGKELEREDADLPDPLNEEHSMKTAHIVHRYPDRVLLLSTMECAMY
ncbi:MAG: lysine 2,3-aminomutase, partial [Lachnospiraceae bacterium]|nr:lysine 2,3-aminomutase [Lachnospiraceae bacterium]